MRPVLSGFVLNSAQESYPQCFKPSASFESLYLMQLVRNDCILNQQFERHDLQGLLMCRLKNDRAASPRSLNLKPPRRANAPSVPRLEPFKTKLWPGRRQIVAKLLGDLKKSLIDYAADRVNAQIIGAVSQHPVR